MNTKKTSRTPSPQALANSFLSFVMDASESELDEELIASGIDPDSLVAQADEIIGNVLRGSCERRTVVSDLANRQHQAHAHLNAGLTALVRLLRRNKGLSESELAEAAKVEVAEIRQIEFDEDFMPSPRTIFQLEKFFGLQPRSLAMMSVITNQSKEFTEGVHSFAAQSKEIGKLSKEELRLLNKFVRFLASEAKKSHK
jgi:transcriptional regulator with XRE-family HTH domain